jgi:VIT1/CCC1 family predicted Fe2+/Mn2+ transporter
MTIIAATAPAAAPDIDQPQPINRRAKANWLRDVILGGQDGLVNILGIVLGVIAAGGSRTVLLGAGFAAAITESISMGAVGYTSTLADRDYYRAMQQRELDAIDAMPQSGREEIRRTYAAKGFNGALLDQIVNTLTSRRDRWVNTVTDDVLHLQPVETRDAVRSSVVITIATLIGHLIPLVPFLWLARTPAVILAIVLSALVLFGVGVYSAKSLVGDWRRGGLKMLVIGLGAAAIGFAIGHLIQATA